MRHFSLIGFTRWLLKVAPRLIVLLAITFAGIYALDRNSVENAPATDFLNYKLFEVQNTLEGSPVKLTVCREFQQKYKIDTDLNIQIVRSDKKETVYNATFPATINQECEDRSIQPAPDPTRPNRPYYRHAPGTYQMNLNVCFKVKYGIEKCTSATSNEYSIYSDPNGLGARILDLSNQLNALKAQEGQPGQLGTNGGGQGGRGGTGTIGATGQTGATGPAGPPGPPAPQPQGLIPNNIPFIGGL